MDAGAAFVAKSIENHLGTRPESLIPITSPYGAEVFEAAIGDRTVLFKADREARGSVVLEAWACQRAGELGAPVPEVLATDLGRESYPRNFIILEKPLGAPLATAGLDREERQRLILETGRAIRAVHEIGVPGFGSLDETTYLTNARVQGEFESWAEYVDLVLNNTLPALRASGDIDDAGVERIDRCIDEFADYLELGPVGHLLHGRFDPGHVLVEAGRVSAIVDFGDRRSGDPAWDLSGFLLSDAADTRHLLAGYEADRTRADALEVTIPLLGGLRALQDARRAGFEGDPDEHDRLLMVADSSFLALGYPADQEP